MTQCKHAAATPQPIPTKVPDALLQRCKKQHEEIGKAINELIAESQLVKSGKDSIAKKPIKILVEIGREKVDGEAVCYTGKIGATSKNVYLVVSMGYLANADCASRTAHTKLMLGRIEEFYDYLINAERNLGAATCAISTHKLLISAIASAKANVSHVARGTYAKKKLVVCYIRNIVDPPKSAAKEADIVYNLFVMEHGETIEHRTIYKWILDYRKKNARPSKTPVLPPSRSTSRASDSPKTPGQS